MNRQKLLLGILLPVLAAALLYAYLAGPNQQKAGSKKMTGPDGRTATEEMQTLKELGLQKLRIDLLEREGEPFEKPKKDIFTLQGMKAQTQEPPAEQVAEEPAPEELFEEVSETPQDERPPAGFEEPPLPMPSDSRAEFEALKKDLAEFSYLGYVSKAGVRTLFLRRQGKIFVVRVGERFGDDFQLTAVNEGWLSLTKGDSPDLILVPTQKDAPLAPVSRERKTKKKK